MPWNDYFHTFLACFTALFFKCFTRQKEKKHPCLFIFRLPNEYSLFWLPNEFSLGNQNINKQACRTICPLTFQSHEINMIVSQSKASAERSFHIFPLKYASSSQACISFMKSTIIYRNIFLWAHLYLSQTLSRIKEVWNHVAIIFLLKFHWFVCKMYRSILHYWVQLCTFTTKTATQRSKRTHLEP